MRITSADKGKAVEIEAHSRGCLRPFSAPRHTQGWPLTHWQGSVRCGCRVVPPPLEISTHRQNRNLHKPPAQPCRSHHQFRPQHTCCTLLHKLRLTLQRPMEYPGLATHTLAGFCALWLPSAASSSANLVQPAKPRPPKTTCLALPQPTSAGCTTLAARCRGCI